MLVRGDGVEEDERSSGSEEADTGQGRPTVVVRDGGRGIRGGRRVDASPRTATLVDRPFARRHRRLARGSPREPTSPPWTRRAPSVGTSGAGGGERPACYPSRRDTRTKERSVNEMPRGSSSPQQEGQRDLVTGNQFREGSAAFVIVFPPPPTTRGSATQVTPQLRIERSLLYQSSLIYFFIPFTL